MYFYVHKEFIAGTFCAAAAAVAAAAASAWAWHGKTSIFCVSLFLPFVIVVVRRPSVVNVAAVVYL